MGTCREPPALPPGQHNLQRLRHLGRNFSLHPEYVPQVRFVRLLPSRRRRASAADVHELGRQADPARPSGLLPPDLGDQEKADSQLPCDLLGRLGRGLVLARAGARDDLEAGQPRELAPHLVRHSIRKVLILRRAQVLEGEHRHALRARRAGGRGGRVFSPPREPHRAQRQSQNRNDGSHDDEPASPRPGRPHAPSPGRRRSTRCRVTKQPLEVGPHLRRVLVAQGRVLLERLPDDLVQAGRDGRVPERGGRGECG